MAGHGGRPILRVGGRRTEAHMHRISRFSDFDPKAGHLFGGLGFRFGF